MRDFKRVRRGIPGGGQFAPDQRAEPTSTLSATFTEDTIRVLTNRHADDGTPVIDLTEGQIAAVRDHIDRTGDFSYTGIRAAAEAAYVADHGYTPAEYSDHVRKNGDISNFFGDPNALRRDIEQARKDALPVEARP